MPYLRPAEPRRQVVLGGVKAGEVVFEEVDDAPLLVEGWDRNRQASPKAGKANLALRNPTCDPLDLMFNRRSLDRVTDEFGIEVVRRAESDAISCDDRGLDSCVDG